MKVQDLPLDSLIPYARNPRKNDGAVDKVAASIKEFGWRSPIVVDEEMVILAGHTRYKAAKKLGLTEAPVHIAEGLTEAQKKAYRIADNRVAEEAEWDSELLRIELEDLTDSNLSALTTGFNLEEIETLLKEPDFEPGTEDDQGKLDELDPKWVDCPHCGKEFDLREQS
jgi:ParB-like chromosome segregation protein Spo0J